MSYLTSTLDFEREQQLLKLFPEPARLHLLLKATQHDFDNLVRRCDSVGEFVLVVYLSSGPVRGAYFSQPLVNKEVDENAFLFDLTTTNATKISPQVRPKSAIVANNSNFYFGESFKFKKKHHQLLKEYEWLVYFSSDEVWTTDWPQESFSITKRDAGLRDVELFRVQGVEDVLPFPWRDLSWEEWTREELRMNLVSHKVIGESVDSVRTLLLGPSGAGKSSFANSIRSVLFKRMTHTPVSGAGAPGRFKRLRSMSIQAGRGGSATALTLCEVMSLGEAESAGLSVSDALSVIKGHVPEGYTFQEDIPFTSGSSGYRPNPGLKDRIHCVLFVLDARKITTYSAHLQSTMRRLQAEISDLDVPQIVLVTHVDEVSHAVREDVACVYTSRVVKDKMQSAAEFMRMPLSYVLPVRNYAAELSTSRNNDILLLSAVDSILQAVDDTLDQLGGTAASS